MLKTRCNRRQFLARASAGLTLPIAAKVASGAILAANARPAFPLKTSDNRRYLVDSKGVPFFVLGDTPWFIQSQFMKDIRMIMDDRVALGYNTLFLELLDDQRIPSIDAHGNSAFAPATDITRPNQVYYDYAEQVVEEAERRGLLVILNSIWFGAGKGLWMHHVTPETCAIHGAYLAKRFARFNNLIWMHVADRNPTPNLAACARALAAAFDQHAPHQLQTAHLKWEFASASYFHNDAWLDVNLAYTYGASYVQVLREYERSDPVRPIILGETGYEDHPNAIENLPDAEKGDRWSPYLIRRNAWWAILSGARGFCNGTRLWRWEKDWRTTLHARSTLETPNLLKLLSAVDWWKLVPDTRNRFLVSGGGEFGSGRYVTASLAEDGDSAVVYMPTACKITLDTSKLNAPFVARWYDPAAAKLTPSSTAPVTNSGLQPFSPPTHHPPRCAPAENDWVLVLSAKPEHY